MLVSVGSIVLIFVTWVETGESHPSERVCDVSKNETTSMPGEISFDYRTINAKLKSNPPMGKYPKNNNAQVVGPTVVNGQCFLESLRNFQFVKVWYGY